MIHWTEGIGKKRKKWTMGCILLSILLCFGAPVSFFARLPEKTAGQARAAEAAKDLTPSVDTVISSVGAYMLSIDTNPDYNSIWNVIGLTRSGISVPASYTDTFYKNVYAYLEQKEWVLTKSKYSDYSKLILGLTAIGKDAQNVGGHNLLAYLSDFTNVKRQGFNGPIWALIALRSHPSYSIPIDPSAVEQTTEEGLITYLLNGETPYGGWTLAGTEPDADMTGMTVQALAPYYGKREDVTAAVDRALAWLSSSQLASGGYGTMGTETSESVAQIVVALSALGVDCSRDSRFIKNGEWPMTGLFQYYLPEGGFMHVKAGASNNGGGEPGTLNGMATEQGMYATAAYYRLLNGSTALYDMSDVTLAAGETVQAPAASEAKKQTAAVPPAVKVSNVQLDYSQITVEEGKTRKLNVTVTPESAANKKVKWTSSNKKIATVTKKGKVKGIKAGTAKIKVTAKDGSGKKAVCTVKVIKPVSSSGGKPASGTGNTAASTGGKPAAGTTAAAKAIPARTDTAAQKTEAETEGWSFEGAAYVPEPSTGTEEVSGEKNEENHSSEAWTDKVITIRIPVGPVFYTLSGAFGLGALEMLILLLKKRGFLRLAGKIFRKG